MIRLRVLTGPNEGASIDVDDDDATIGRDPRQCSVLLRDHDVRPIHVTLSRNGADVFEIDVAPDAALQVDGAAVAAGRHRIGRVALLGIGGSELLVQWHDSLAPTAGDDPASSESVDETGPGRDSAETAASKPRNKLPRALATVGAIAGCLVLGWLFTLIIVDSATADSGSKAQVTARASWKATRSASEGAVAYDPGLTTRPASVTHRNGGSVLYETPAASVTPAATPEAQTVHRLRRFVDEGGAPSLETIAGDRFELGSATSEGYSMRWLGNEAIELSRGPERIRIEVD